jgi:hypothetical protein
MLVQVKSFEAEREHLELLVKKLIKEVTQLRKDISEKKDILKIKHNEVMEKNNSCLRIELQSLRHEFNKKATNNDSFHCITCNLKTVNLVELKQHVIKYHRHNKESQVDECSLMVNDISTCETDMSIICEYSCLYCELVIKSADHIQEHRSKCQDKFSNFSILFPCEQCGAKCTDRSDLRRHRITDHELGKQLFWCDVCPIYYER